jgi:predicted phage baseplate assembly protein
VSQPVRKDASGVLEAEVTWRYSKSNAQPGAWDQVQTFVDGTEGLRHGGRVAITPPAGWSSQNPSTDWTATPATPADTLNRSLWWVGIRVGNLLTTQPVKVGLRSVLHNTASATNALTAASETTVSNGQAHQIVELAHQPLLKRRETDTPYDHLAVTVAGVPWRLVEDLPAGPANAFLLDPVAGELRFGDYSTTNPAGHGSIPPAGAPIQVASYRYVAGGAAGNVGSGTVTAMRTPVGGIIGVTNLLPAVGGSDEEPIEQTKRRAPQLLRTRDRAVTADDYEYLAREATTDVAVVRCLEPRLHETDNSPWWTKGSPWDFGELNRAPGNVHLIVVPDYGPDEPRPEPNSDLLLEVLGYLDKRRDLTARLQVTGPRYLQVVVTATLGVWQSAIDGGLTTVAAASLELERRIRRFLHPVHGGPDGRGWQVGQHVLIADLYRAVMPSDDIGYISYIALTAEQPPIYHLPPVGKGGAWTPGKRPFALALAATAVRVADYELVCDTPGNHAITASAIT